MVYFEKDGPHDFYTILDYILHYKSSEVIW